MSGETPFDSYTVCVNHVVEKVGSSTGGKEHATQKRDRKSIIGYIVHRWVLGLRSLPVSRNVFVGRNDPPPPPTRGTTGELIITWLVAFCVQSLSSTTGAWPCYFFFFFWLIAPIIFAPFCSPSPLFFPPYEILVDVTQIIQGHCVITKALLPSPHHGPRHIDAFIFIARRKTSSLSSLVDSTRKIAPAQAAINRRSQPSWFLLFVIFANKLKSPSHMGL